MDLMYEAHLADLPLRAPRHAARAEGHQRDRRLGQPLRPTETSRKGPKRSVPAAFLGEKEGNLDVSSL